LLLAKRYFHQEISTANDEEIRSCDVLCGRDRESFRHNRKFRAIVSLSLDQYVQANSKKEKSVVILSVIEQVRRTSGRFLKWKDGRLVELDERQTREKVGHAIRDMAVARDLVKPSKLSKSDSRTDMSAASAGTDTGSIWSRTDGSSVSDSRAVAAQQQPHGHRRQQTHFLGIDNTDLHELFSDLSQEDAANVQSDSEQNKFLDLFEKQLDVYRRPS